MKGVGLLIGCWNKQKLPILLEESENMNFKTRLSFVCLAVGLSGLLFSSAHATPITTPINITMSLPLNGTSTLVGDVQAQNIPGNGLGSANVLSWLQLDVSTYDSNLGMSLVAPPNNSTYTAEGDNSVTVDAGDYLVLHYGAGQGGSSSGGLVALYFATTTDYSVPQNGSGPNGFGGISFVSLYTSGTTTVPDGGSTIFLLGAALTGLAILFRWNKS
jgi:hypothetical protein